jgi:glutamine synthetase
MSITAQDLAAEMFATDVLTLEELRQRLSKPVWKSLSATVAQGARIDPAIAEYVALAMKTWALEKGATHYTHWFQPLTGVTAEKHESFVTMVGDGTVVAQFSGKELIQGEPDASSFPSGGLRATFEARGYTAWDPTSPAFIMRHSNGATLCIPSAFASWTGEALDNKTPLLRSMDALQKVAFDALALFGESDATAIASTVGAEQEYFLIDEEFYTRRPDLMMTGRTLFGAKPPRGQELEDHYFGSIPNRVLTFMSDAEAQMHALGIPIKTRHNEVAPGQYEIAPIFEQSNVAADHQQLVMHVLQSTARTHGFVCLLHEKPFAGINGSGKHVNWSVSTNEGLNLLEPGDTPETNTRFLFFCVAVLRAVDTHQALLRACVASAANDHRLGANEAPPAIISVFLGDQLTTVFEHIANGVQTKQQPQKMMELGTTVLPTMPRHASDRNRTSPFAFTGNKFEFRAVGSSQSISFPITVLNTIVAESIAYCTGLVNTKRKGKTSVEAALLQTIAEVYTTHQRIVFNGDGYGSAWKKEAKKRGLLNLATSLEAIESLMQPQHSKLFETYNVLTVRELEAREEVMLDQYFKTINIEAETTEWMAQTQILPGVVGYLLELNAASAVSKTAKQTATKVSAALDSLSSALDALHKQNALLGGDSVHSKARHMNNNVIPAMQSVRAAADALEHIVAQQHWPLPSYREMFFVK